MIWWLFLGRGEILLITTYCLNVLQQVSTIFRIRKHSTLEKKEIRRINRKHLRINVQIKTVKLPEGN